jgi:hypothetical protein
VVDRPLPHLALSVVPKAARLYDAGTVRAKAFYRYQARFCGPRELVELNRCGGLVKSV